MPAHEINHGIPPWAVLVFLDTLNDMRIEQGHGPAHDDRGLDTGGLVIVSTNTLKALDPVGGPHESGQVPTGRATDCCNAVGINTESPGIGPRPADRGLAIMDSSRERRLTR